MSKQYDVFLSYSHDDVAWVSKLHDDLIRCGVTVARDQGIQHGDLFPPALEEFMANSKAVALVISAASLQSPWVKQELSYAHVLASERVEPAKLIPVLLQGAPDAKALGFLGTRHWVDFRDEKTYAKSLQQLVSAITGEERPCPENRDTRESRLLWRLAYAFLRLDQLPSGGWARSLPGWYQTLENNSEKGRSRAYEYRVIGGMNLTCLGLLHYTRALCAVLGENPDDSGYGQTNHEEFSRFLKALNAVEHRNRVAQRAVRHILRRLNADGAIPDQWERTRDRDVLHTVFGIIVLLLAYLLSGSNVEPATDYYKALVAMCKYLERNGRDVTWSNGRRYEAHCAITFLEHLLKNDFFKTANANAKAELNKLPAILAAIRVRLG